MAPSQAFDAHAYQHNHGPTIPMYGAPAADNWFPGTIQREFNDISTHGQNKLPLPTFQILDNTQGGDDDMQLDENFDMQINDPIHPATSECTTREPLSVPGPFMWSAEQQIVDASSIFPEDTAPATPSKLTIKSDTESVVMKEPGSEAVSTPTRKMAQKLIAIRKKWDKSTKKSSFVSLNPDDVKAVDTHLGKAIETIETSRSPTDRTDKSDAQNYIEDAFVSLVDADTSLSSIKRGSRSTAIGKGGTAIDTRPAALREWCLTLDRMSTKLREIQTALLGGPLDGGNKKPRAKITCPSCRTRKVKCDIGTKVTELDEARKTDSSATLAQCTSCKGSELYQCLTEEMVRSKQEEL